MRTKRKRSRKEREAFVPYCKEVKFVAVTTARLGTRMRTQPVRKSSMASPSKNRMLDSHDVFTASNAPSTQSPLDFANELAFDYPPEFIVGSSSSPSKKKQPGKASQYSYFGELLG
jgi:hypothetical protein